MRHLAGCLTLLLMAACVVGTFIVLRPAEGFQMPFATSTTSASAASAPGGTAPFTAIRTAGSSAPAFLPESGLWRAVEARLPWVVGLWALGVAFLSIRLGGGWLQVCRTRRRGCEPPDDPLRRRFDELRARLGVNRHVRLVITALVRVPAVVGWFRPLILLPASTLSGLSPVQVDLLLAHELAHLRRWDQWVNLGQLILETVLFYHPAVWWVSRCVSEDREQCCDELAVTACGHRLALAQALTALEEFRQANAAFALAATDGSLLARVRRILALPDDERGGIDRRTAGSALLALGMVMFVTGAVLYATSPRLQTALLTMKVPRPTWERNTHFDYFSSVGEDIQSQSVLLPVIHSRTNAMGEELKPGERFIPAWSHRLGLGEEEVLSDQEACSYLRRQLKITAPHDSGLVEIAVTTPVPEEAVSLANLIAASYINRRQEGRRAQVTNAIAILQNNLAEQDRDIKELQSKVDELRIDLGIPGIDAASGSPPPLPARAHLTSLLQALGKARVDLVLWETKLKSLESLEGEDTDKLRAAIFTIMPTETLLRRQMED